VTPCPHCGAPTPSSSDARTAQWRVRVRLYREPQLTEPEADTDKEQAPDYPGETVIAGLPGVAEHLRELAIVYHGPVTAGLDAATLLHRLKALRPTLSRRGGDAVWRVPYTVSGAGWLARVDVRRENGR